MRKRERRRELGVQRKRAKEEVTKNKNEGKEEDRKTHSWKEGN